MVAQAAAAVEGNQVQMAEFGQLMAAMLNPFDGSAENIQVPGQIDGTQLYFNTTTESLSVPPGADRAVIVLDAIGSTRNGETGATIYFVDSSKVSQASPQSLSDGCIIAERRVTTGLNCQLFDVCDAFSVGISAADRTSDEFVKGTTSAITYIGRDTWAPQMYPGKIGRLVSQDRDYLSGVSKDQRVTAVARNPAALFGAPFRQGYNQKQNTYANTIQGAATYTSSPLSGSPNSTPEGIACYAGNANYDNFSILAADAQLSQLTDVRSQTFTVGSVPRVPVTPKFPPAPSTRIQLWSTRDMPAMETSSGGSIDAQFPRDTNAMRFSGNLRMTGPLNTLPYKGQREQVNTGQGIAVPPYTVGVNGNGTDLMGNSLPFVKGNAINCQGDLVYQDSTATTGYNNVWWTGMSQPVGGWEVNIELLGGTRTNSAGDVEDRVIGRAVVYGALGTKNNVVHSAQCRVFQTNGEDPDNPAQGQFTIHMNGNPVVTSESLGSIVLDEIVVRPGMGMDDSNGEQFSRGENVTGARIWVQAMDKPTAQGGQPRNVPCFADGTSSVANNVDVQTSGTYQEGPTVTFSESPLGPEASAQGYVVMGGGAPGAWGVTGVVVTAPGWGYTSPPTIKFDPAGAEATCTLHGTVTSGRANAQQYGFELTNVNGEFLRYDADASTSKRQIIMMDGLIPSSSSGVTNASSNITVTLSQYVTARLKAFKSPIQLNTSRDHVANNKVMACALAEVAKYSPELFANELSLQLAQAIFFSLGGPETALHAASSGHSAGLWDIGKRMFGAAKKAYNTVENAISSLSPSTKAALGNLSTGPEAMRALSKVKSMVGLSNVPNSRIAEGAELANRHLSELFSMSDGVGAGFFDTVSGGLDLVSKGLPIAKQLGILSGTDSGFRSGTDSGFRSGTDSGMGAGFWSTVGDVAQVALPLLLDDGSYARGRGRYAADASFPVLNRDGTAAGKLDLVLTSKPQPLREYTSQHSRSGDVHFDSRLESVVAGESQNAFNLAKGWMKQHPEYTDMYVTVKENLAQPLFGRSWEAAFASSLAGQKELITGKINHVGPKGKAHIGPIVGAGEKARMAGLVVPQGNSHEAPGNRTVSTIDAF